MKATIETINQYADYCLNTNNPMPLRIVQYQLLVAFCKKHGISLEYIIDDFADIQKAMREKHPK